MSFDFPPPEPYKGVDNAPLFVSIYSVLLAFFIVLTGMANDNVLKSQALIDSVRKAFGATLGDSSGLQVSIGSDRADARFIGEMEQSLSQLVQVKEVEAQTKGDTMVITMPEYVIFLDQEEIAIDPAAEDFLNAVVQSVTKWAGTHRMDVTLLAGYNEADAQPDKTPEAVLKAATLARDLINRKLPAGLIHTGISREVPAGQLQFLFRLHGKRAKNQDAMVEP